MSTLKHLNASTRQTLKFRMQSWVIAPNNLCKNECPLVALQPKTGVCLFLRAFHVGCVSINATYTGLHIQHIEADDYKACSVQCGFNPFCTAWTFHTDLGLCSLFSGQATLSHKPVRGALSGDKACGASTEQDQGCFEDGILYSLDNILGVRRRTTS